MEAFDQNDWPSRASFRPACTYDNHTIVYLYYSESDETSLKLAQLYNNRGWTRYMQVDFYKAIEDYNLALKYQPKLSEALYNRGTINYRMGNVA